MNIWPPFLGAGIRVKEIDEEFKFARVELKSGLLNRNYVGTHYGGSLFSMTDPFYMLMLLHNLGKDYIVWDKAAEINYKKPGKGRLRADFNLPPSKSRKFVIRLILNIRLNLSSRLKFWMRKMMSWPR